MSDIFFKQACFKAMISVFLLLLFLSFIKVKKERYLEKNYYKIEDVQTFSTFFDNNKSPQWQNNLQIWAEFWTPTIYTGSSNPKMNFYFPFGQKKLSPKKLELVSSDKEFYNYLLIEKPLNNTNENFDFKDFIKESNGFYFHFSEKILEKKSEKLSKLLVYDVAGKTLKDLQTETWSDIFKKLKNPSTIEVEVKDLSSDFPIVILRKGCGDAKINEDLVRKLQKELTKISFRKYLKENIVLNESKKIIFQWNNL